MVNEAELPVFPDEAAGNAEAGDAAASGDQAPMEAPATVGLGDLIRVTVVLAALIGLIYLLLYFLKKISPMAESDEDLIRILSTRHLRRDNSLHLVEVGSQIFLVGAGTSSVGLVSEITDRETLDRIRLESEAKAAPAGSRFRSLLEKGLRGGGTSSSLKEETPRFLRTQRDRLRNLGEGE